MITAVVDGRSVALTRCRGKLGALALFSEKGWAATGARDVAAAAGVSVEKNAILIASSGPRPPNEILQSIQRLMKRINGAGH